MFLRLAIWPALALALAACSAGIVRNAPPPERMTEAAVPGIPNARYWRGRTPENLDALLAEMRRQRAAAGIDGADSMLALSGGADDGAFGAGLLAAWTARGDRPEFHVVTGVSTGALSAPFAFLGPEWDDDLKQVYGGFPPERIFLVHDLLRILPNAAAADSHPLAELIGAFVDDAFLAAIAKEHRRGRRLLVQTTDLDAQRAAIWNLGAIADSGAPGAEALFEQVLLASASVPGAFPPVLIEVGLDGRTYDEMHADGGVISEDTVLSDWQSDLRDRVAHRHGERSEIYVVRNGRIGAEPKQIEYDLLAIAGRAASTMIKSQGTDDLLTAYEVAQLRDAEIRLTWIGEDFDAPYPAPFDPGYMQALFQYGFDLMTSGRAWETTPPQLMTEAERRRALRRKP